ncbi:MAG: hypothetical protein CM1200mP18_17570 [Gammaproteobacteria bacterium]|nr:MAG: hypothetical protein CM1200mP18_17570 [Gammaproteobacteria bacterium]
MAPRPAGQNYALLRPPARSRCRLGFGIRRGKVPLWFAPEGVEPRDKWSYRVFNSMPHVGAECRAVVKQLVYLK